VYLGRWAVMVVLTRRLPLGLLREVTEFLPSCVTAARRLRRSPNVPRRARVALLVAVLWVVSPIDLIPKFLPGHRPTRRRRRGRAAAALRRPLGPAPGTARGLAGAAAHAETRPGRPSPAVLRRSGSPGGGVSGRHHLSLPQRCACAARPHRLSAIQHRPAAVAHDPDVVVSSSECCANCPSPTCAEPSPRA
jgi:hypothetical protein